MKGDLLSEIMQHKYHEVEELRQEVYSNAHHPYHAICTGTHKRPKEYFFKSALKQQFLAIIAEVKRKSPSKGELGQVAEPASLARLYEKGGASAISILTDEKYFGGTLEDLKTIYTTSRLPLLRKDFILDPLQIAEGIYCGASAILLIVSVLQEHLESLMQAGRTMGVDLLVEVRNHEEIKRALDCGADMIGVNNRDLKTFEVDIHKAEELAPLIPSHIIKVAESGIETNQDAKRMLDAGYHAILVGESLIKSKDPKYLISELRIAANE